MARTGYTLPVFAVAAAKAALICATGGKLSEPTVAIDLLSETAEIPVREVAAIGEAIALAITTSDPGDNLDLTRNTSIWAVVTLSPRGEVAFVVEAGEGLGKTAAGEAAIYEYANRLFKANLLPLVPPDRTATVRIVLPEGRQLARRTSNEAFGILEGLALLGTSGISQPHSAADYLEESRASLREKVRSEPNLVFCLGSNGERVARKLLLPESAIVRVGNWIGALLVEAGLHAAESILLIGYHGKLIKLAANIFNTSSHLADAKLEILSAAVANSGGDLRAIQTVLNSQTADDAYKKLTELGLAQAVFENLTQKIGQNSQKYVSKYANFSLKVGAILFDRQGDIFARDAVASGLLKLHSIEENSSHSRNSNNL